MSYIPMDATPEMIQAFARIFDPKRQVQTFPQAVKAMWAAGMPTSSNTHDDLIYDALGNLAVVPTYEINLCNHPEAWRILEDLINKISEPMTNMERLKAIVPEGWQLVEVKNEKS